MSNSGRETEAKFYVLDLRRLERHLQDLGARLVQSRILERNIRFDLPDARLRAERRVLRLRQDIQARLTYKSASSDQDGVLSRTEIEFIVEDFEKAKAFLNALGYESFFYYEKYRTTYTLDSARSHDLVSSQRHGETAGGYDCHIMLDEMPYGDFVEIEGETVESIRHVSDAMHLNWDAAIAASYYAIFRHLCEKRPDLDPTRLSFAALNGVKITAEDLYVQPADA
ncbi:MAG TPA: class IV adenylate cyclase [Anaerolineales bacterium]|nr:class IV adenylate cyclase [Anaerolineales bacterium]